MARKQNLLPLIAIATFAVSWFVPVHRAGARLAGSEMPGWQAFRLSLSRIWALQDITLAQLPYALLAPGSALTNFWFVASAFLLLRRPGAPDPVVKWGLLLSAALNMFWFVLGSDRGDLLPGYYLWVASFAMLAVAAFDRGAPREARG